MDTTTYFPHIILFLCFVIIAILSGIIIVLRKNKEEKNDKVFQGKHQSQIESLTLSNNKMTRFNELQFKTILEFKAHLSSVIAPFRQLLEQNGLPAELFKQIQIANKSTLGVQNISFLLEELNKEFIDDSTFEISKYKVNSLCNTIINYYNQLLNAYTIKLFIFKDKENNDVFIDYNKITFILKVLISNAYRHINYNGTIWVAIKNTEINNKKYYIFTITDDGLTNGTTEVFDSFINKNSEEACLKNNDVLGLDIITKLASGHDGGIKINSNSEGFREYSLYVPMGNEHWNDRNDIKYIDSISIDSNPINDYSDSKSILLENEEENDKIQIGKIIDYDDKNRKKLLIIEDHRDIQLYLKIIFEKEYDVIIADNGRDGLDKAISEIPSIIICDVMMPVMNGFECCKQLKDNIKTCYIPIVLLTALVEEEDIVKGLELGVEDYIVKPFNPKILKTKINNIVLQRSKLRRSYTSTVSPESYVNTNNTTAEKQDPLIEKIIKIIEKNIQNPDFGVKMLSDELNMSQPTLYRKIKQMTNFTTIELIVGVRLKTSAELLKNGKNNVQEVAELVGYNDIATFRKHFIDYYGVTPSIYSRKNTPIENKS